MTDKEQSDALRLAALLDADEWPGSMTLVSYARECVAELRRQHGELETLRTGYAAARLEIESLKAQLHAAKQINTAQFWLFTSSIPGSALRASHWQAPAQPAPQQEAQEPFAWHVCSVNSDGSLSLEHAAAWEEAAHEHIKDAITEHDIEGAGSWVVRPAYHAPQPTTQPAPQQEAQEPVAQTLASHAAGEAGDCLFSRFVPSGTPLYAAPQPVEREPLTPERVKEIVRGAGYDQCGIPDTEREAFINGLRHGEREHGIKGGQHGTE